MMIEKIVDTLKFLLANPAVAAVVIVVAWMMYWLQSRLFRRVLRKQAEANRAGWTTSAATSTVRHQTGVGTQNVLVMRPPRRMLSIAIWTLLLSVGAAAFYWFAVLPDQSEEETVKNWITFAMMCAFSVLSIAVFIAAFTRIYVSAEDIVQRRLFRRSQRFALSEISSVAPAGKNPATGVKLSFLNGERITLLASYEGYAQVVSKIQGAHPDLPKLLMMGRMVDAAVQHRKQGVK